MLVCVLFLLMFIVEHVGLSGLEHCFVEGPSTETVVSIMYAAKSLCHILLPYMKQQNVCR